MRTAKQSWRHTHRTLAFRSLLSLMIFSIVSFTLATAVVADDTGAEQAGANTESLVAKLAGRSFSVREAAMQELIQLGSPVLEQMIALQESPDHELRFRSRHIAAEIVRQARPGRLHRFAAGEQLSGRMQVPGWDCLAKMSVNEELSDMREMWVGVLQHEWNFLEELAGSEEPRSANIVMKRLSELNAGKSWDKKRVGKESILALMVGSIQQCDLISDAVAIQIYSLLHQVDNVNNGISVWDEPSFRLVFGRFLTQAQGPSALYQGLNLAMRHNFEREGLEIAERVIQSGGGLSHVRQYAILAIARFGNQEHAAVLEELLDDTGVFFTGKVNGSRRQKIECQVRDLALASLAHLTGRDPRAMGFPHLQPNNAFVFLPHTVGFTSEDERLAVMAKFRGELPQVPTKAAMPADTAPTDLGPADFPEFQGKELGTEQLDELFDDQPAKAGA